MHTPEVMVLFGDIQDFLIIGNVHKGQWKDGKMEILLDSTKFSSKSSFPYDNNLGHTVCKNLFRSQGIPGNRCNVPPCAVATWGKIICVVVSGTSFMYPCILLSLKTVPEQTIDHP